MTREVMTARLYGGEEGWTLSQRPLKPRPNRHVSIARWPGVDIWHAIEGIMLVFVLLALVVLAMGGCAASPRAGLIIENVNWGEDVVLPQPGWEIANTKEKQWAYDTEFRLTWMFRPDEIEI